MNTENQNTLLPHSKTERIISLDVLRGFALLGILIMNIQHFSMPGAAYINPDAYGDLSGINKWVWILSHILASEKFMSIFSMLFGAGILLFTDHVISHGRKAGPLHYRRMFWLLIFGMLHAYLLWSGDILVTYSLCGMLAFVFRKKKPATLVWIGVIFFLFPFLFYSMGYLTMPMWPEESVKQSLQGWKPDPVEIQNEVAAFQGNWMAQMEQRVPASIFMQTGIFLMEVFWRVMAMMLLGMGLYKWKIITAERSGGFYIRMILFGLISGYLLSGLGVFLNFRNDWGMQYSMFLGKQFNYFGSVATALGYIGIIMLICKSLHFKGFKRITASVGRMAFSNYILMTLICTFIFYGHGLAQFGLVERKYQILFVPGVWIVLMIISPLWLKYFRYGPLEWFWRRLTYRR